jgi:hypothetical protein
MMTTSLSDGGEVRAGHARPDTRPPFASYAAFAATFNAALAGAVVVARRSGRDLPERVEPGDLVLIGAASHKLSRLVAKDRITGFVRAPFTELQGRGAPAEVEERPRGRGLRRAVGELLVCPYCLGLWVSGGFHAGLLFVPRSTRFAASVLSALTISDFLQAAFRALEQQGSRDR